MKRQVGGRFAIVLALLVVALLATGAVGKAAICLTVIAAMALIWAIVEAVACRWFMRLLHYKHLIYLRDTEVAVIAGALVTLLGEGEKKSQGE